MLRLRGFIVSQLLSSPCTFPISHFQRLLSATAPPVSPSPPISPSQAFAVEDYLVDTCGLTRTQAVKASTKLSHLKSSSKPDAVLAFFADLGFSSADVAATVVRDPKLLCASVERTLAPRVSALSGLGLSRPDIARLIRLVGSNFRLSIVSDLHFFLSLFGSSEHLLRVLERGSYLIGGADLEKVVKPNVEFLRECGLDACDIAKVCIPVPRILAAKPERVRAMVTCAEGLGVPRGSGMFRQALQAVAFLSEEKIAGKVDYLKKTFRWSDAEVRTAVAKLPNLLRKGKDVLRRSSEFLISEAGLEPAYMAHRPAIISYSMEGRLRPRYYVLKFLKANRLVDHDRDYYSTVACTENVFVEKFICSHKQAAPHLAEDYEAACRGEVPTRFRFT